MKATIVGGGGTVEVKEQADGTLLAEDGTAYKVEHVSGMFTFVREAEAIIDKVEDAVTGIEETVDELGYEDNKLVAEAETIEGKVEDVIDGVETGLADGIEVAPIEETADEPQNDQSPAEGSPEA